MEYNKFFTVNMFTNTCRNFIEARNILKDRSFINNQNKQNIEEKSRKQQPKKKTLKMLKSKIMKNNESILELSRIQSKQKENLQQQYNVTMNLSNQKFSHKSRSIALTQRKNKKSLSNYKGKENLLQKSTSKGLQVTKVVDNVSCSCQKPCKWGIKFLFWSEMPNSIQQKYYKLKEELFKLQKLQSQQNKALGINNNKFQKSFVQIKKDVVRSYPHQIKNKKFIETAEQILKIYAIEDQQLGYVQGMNNIICILLFHLKDSLKAYAVFHKLMKKIRSIFLNQFSQTFKHIEQIVVHLKKFMIDVHLHFHDLQISYQQVLFPWIASLLAKIFKLQFYHLIIFGFMKEGWIYIYRVVLSIISHYRQKILQMSQNEDILVLLSASSVNQDEEINWKLLIQYSQRYIMF